MIAFGILAGNLMDLVTVRYHATTLDFFSAIAWKMARSLWFLLWMPIAGIWGIVDPSNGAITRSSGLIIITVWTVLFVVLPLISAFNAAKNPNAAGPVTLTISAAGLESTTEHAHVRTDWIAVRNVSESRRSIFITLQSSGSLVVPKRRLSDEQIRSLRDALRLYAPGGARLKPA